MGVVLLSCIDQCQTNSAYFAKWCFSLGIVSIGDSLVLQLVANVSTEPEASRSH